MKKIMIQKGNKWKLRNKLEAEDWLSILAAVLTAVPVIVNILR